MLLKRFFLGALFFTMFVNISGCASTGDTVDSEKAQYRIASDECLRFGHRRDSYDYKQCVEKRLKSRK